MHVAFFFLGGGGLFFLQVCVCLNSCVSVNVGWWKIVSLLKKKKKKSGDMFQNSPKMSEIEGASMYLTPCFRFLQCLSAFGLVI